MKSWTDPVGGRVTRLRLPQHEIPDAPIKVLQAGPYTGPSRLSVGRPIRTSAAVAPPIPPAMKPRKRSCLTSMTNALPSMTMHAVLSSENPGIDREAGFGEQRPGQLWLPDR